MRTTHIHKQHFFHSHNLIDSTKLLKTDEKMRINKYVCIEFLHENYQQQAYTVLIVQQYTQYNDTTACMN